MCVNNRYILLAAVIIALILIPLAVFTSGVPRILLGFLFIVFLPGYVTLSALYPKQSSLSGIERLALSFGLSIAIVPVIGLALNYTPWGIKLVPILITTGLYIIILAVIAWYRQRNLQPQEAIWFTWGFKLRTWPGMPRTDKVLSIVLAAAIILSIAAVAYIATLPKVNEKMTEFYILGPDGKAEYPQEIARDLPVTLIVGIVNYENEASSYKVEVKNTSKVITGFTTETLANNEPLERTISFTPPVIGEKQRFDFYLYRNDAAQPYFKEPLHLFISIY